MPILLFLIGLIITIGTLSSALSTFVLPRAARSQLNRLVFGFLRRVVEIPMRFAHNYAQRDAIMAYYAPIGLMLLVPTWYFLIAIGYALMYAALGYGNLVASFKLSGSSLLTLGIISSDVLLFDIFMFSEAVIGLILVALLIAYLPTMYSAFSRREQAVTMLEVRAGDPPAAETMLLASTASTASINSGMFGKRGRFGSPRSKRVTAFCPRWSSSARRAPTIRGSPPRARCWTGLH